MSTQKNILLVISKFPPEYSGPGVRIPRLYQWLKEQDKYYHFQVLCNGIEQTKSAQYEHDGISVRRVVADGLNALFAQLPFLPRRLTHALVYQAEFLKTLTILASSKAYKDVDLVHIAGHSGGTVAALLWAKWRKKPVLMELVNAIATPYQKYLFLFKVTVSGQGKIAFLTKSAADKYKNGVNIQNKIWVKPNPVDTDIYKDDIDNKFSYRKKISQYNDRDIIILSVAKFMPRKNQVFLIDVLKNLPNNYKLILAGPLVKEGPLYNRDKKYYEDIKSKIKQFFLEERVQLVPDYVDSSIYLKASDIYVLPAWGEGLGTPMLEALACGVPVVANRAEPAFQEWVGEGENGFLCSLDSPEAWAQKIIEANNFDFEKRKIMSQKISDKVSQYSIFLEYKNVLDDII